MRTLREHLDEIDQLPAHERWQLVRHVLRLLEHESKAPATDWHELLQASYGSLKDTPIERHDPCE